MAKSQPKPDAKKLDAEAALTKDKILAALKKFRGGKSK